MLFDVSGTLTQSTFIPKVLVPYFKAYFTVYLEENYDKEECKTMIQELRAEAQLDVAAGPTFQIEPADADKKAIIESVSRHINHCLENSIERKAYILFRFKVWFDGLAKDIIKVPVYADVATQLQNWRTNLGIRLFVLSNGWSVATRKFMEKTSKGDLSLLVSDFWDTDIGELTRPETYRLVIERIGEQPEEIVFLSKNLDEARAAKSAGLVVVLVLTHRSQVTAVSEACRVENIPHIRSFDELNFN